jgi:hypothetical protein
VPVRMVVTMFVLVSVIVAVVMVIVVEVIVPAHMHMPAGLYIGHHHLGRIRASASCAH